MIRASMYIVVVGVGCAAVVGGPLNPPAGPVAPTNKTLEEMEPRTPLVGSTITLPGSYYLTEDHTSTISIQTSGVTLDLNGFTISTGGSGDGILNTAGLDLRPITIRNGYITDVIDGIDCSGTFMLVVEDVHVSNCLGRGISTDNDATIRHCTVLASAGNGFEVDRHGVFEGCTANSSAIGFRVEAGALENCVATGCSAQGFGFGFDGVIDHGVSAVNCVATNCGNVGLSADCPVSLAGCVASGGATSGFFVGDGGSLSDCVANENADNGFLISGGASCSLRGCEASANGSAGINAGRRSSLTGCVARGNQGFAGIQAGENSTLIGCTSDSNANRGIVTFDGCVISDCGAHRNISIGFATGAGCRISGCSAVANDTDGYMVSAGSNLSGCTAFQNMEDGFVLSSGCRMFNCNAEQNGGGAAGGAFAGIRSEADATVDSCTVSENPTGILADNGALIIRCSASGNGTNYSLGASDYGAIISPAGSFTETNSFANIEY